MTTIRVRDVAAWIGVDAGRAHMSKHGRTDWNEDDFAAAIRARDDFNALTAPEIAEHGEKAEFLNSRNAADNAMFADAHAKIEAALYRGLGAAPEPAELRLVNVLERLAPEWVARVKARR